MKLKIYILSFLCFSLNFAFTQQFEATTNNTTVIQGKPFEVRFTLYDAKGKNYVPPNFDQFIVRSGPNRSSSMQWVNGDMTSNVSYSYYLQVNEVGNVTIGAATVEAKDKILSTKPIEIEVVASQDPIASTPGSSSNTQTPGKAKSQQPAGSVLQQIEDNAFVQVAVSKSSVYQGEPLTVTFKLIHKLPGSNFGVSKNPAMNGFWVEDHSPDQISFKREVINGVQYQTALIKSATIYPQRAGQLEIDAMEIDLAVRASRSFFDNRVYEHTIKSNPLAIQVTALPSEGRPSSYSGAVGRFTMSSTVDQLAVNVDDPITFKMQINGQGNMKMINPPDLNLSKDFEVYDPKISQKRNSKTFEYLIIPRHGGQYKLDPFTFSFFDLESKSYQTLETESYIFDITGDLVGTNPGAGNISGIRKEEVALLGEDIRYINTGSPNWKNQNTSFFYSGTFWALSSLPPLLFLGLLAMRRLKPAKDEQALRIKHAEKKAEKHLISAKQLMDHPSNEFYTMLNASIYGYLGDKLGIDPAKMNKNFIAAQLQSRNVSQQCVSELNQLISNSEMALYAPLPENMTRAHMMEAATQLIHKLEQEIR